MSPQRKILVVEDEPINQQLVQETLQNSGFDVILAANGQEALDKVYAEHPDLIVCDVLMPVMDGYTFYKEIRKDEILSQIPVIILTARGKMEDTFKTVGVNSFIAKPYSADILLAEIKKLLLTQPVSIASGGRLGQQLSPGKSLNRKVIIVGRESTVTHQMNKQLLQENCGVLVIKDENQLSLHFDRVNPDMIILQIFDDGYKSTYDVLLELKKLVQRKFQDAQHRPLADGQLEYRMPYILLYKIPEEVSGVSSMAGNIADIENFLTKSSAVLPFKYIGIYVADSFISKVKKFLSE